MKRDQDKMVGRVKKAAGDLTDNDDLRDEGNDQETAGKAKEAVDKAAEGLHDAIDKVRGKLS